jgi:hypothetical protein
MDKFTLAYIEAALWASNDESDEKGGEPLDANYGISDIGPGTLAEMIDDCKRFQEENAADIAAGPDGPDYTRYERAGQDFLLTRNHHGAGFWDGDWPEEVGERLTAASHAYGEVNLYVGDGGLIYA